jgi:uncharacterized protein (DUF488 family)
VEKILGIPYVSGACLAPTKELLSSYQEKTMTWDQYERAYLDLLEERFQLIQKEVRDWGHDPVLICSEHLPERCHRRLAAEFLLNKGLVERIEHLVM